MDLRQATATDIGALADLWRAAGLTRPWNDPVADARRALETAASTILVLADDAGIAGSVMVGDDGHRGWMYYLATDPARLRQGIARRLVMAAEDWLRMRGCPKVELMVRDGNSAALGFYARLGYAPQPVSVHARWLNGQDDAGTSRR